MIITDFILVGAVSYALCFLIYKTRFFHAKYTSDHLIKVQKMHLGITPRIGGLGIYIALLFANFISPLTTNSILNTVIVFGALVFFIGIYEDIAKNISAKIRLTLIFFASFIFCYTKCDSAFELFILDKNHFLIFKFLLAILISLFICGLANAVNIIDGLNGLASSYVIISLICVALMANSCGDLEVFMACSFVSVAYFGFFLINWPRGYIFLGDGGAYFGGFALSLLIIMLIQRNPSISPFSAILICIYPMTETIFSIWRRLLSGQSPLKADNMHLHTILYALLKKKKNNNELLSLNSKLGLLIGISCIPFLALANIFFNNSLIIGISILFYVCTYVVLYRFFHKLL